MCTNVGPQENVNFLWALGLILNKEAYELFSKTVPHT